MNYSANTNYTPFLDAKKIDFTPFLGAKNIRISLIYGAKKIIFVPFPLKNNHIRYEEIL